ncbi:MAG: hypothetical protein GVY16_12400 [Planctomycetes bacterium]|jgi:hypothetical protein|nr:hypothetical protein [Phycisphaerae bacterium]NBB96520.1 hypothetical protein [Planctomycetota bacterium]
MIQNHMGPKQYVLDENDHSHWGALCKQADATVRRGRRHRPKLRKPPKPRFRTRAVLWLAEHLAGAVAGTAIFAVVWNSLDATVSSGHLRTLLAGAPALTGWVLMVLLIRWAPSNKLAYLLDR